MVRENRIKDYTFGIADGNATTISQTSSHPVNGELLRVMAAGNFTGSVILSESGTAMGLCNYSVASGTGVYTNLNFTVTTGSFCINNNIILTVGSLVSGTGNTFGPVSIFYR